MLWVYIYNTEHINQPSNLYGYKKNYHSNLYSIVRRNKIKQEIRGDSIYLKKMEVYGNLIMGIEIFGGNSYRPTTYASPTNIKHLT